MLVQTRTEPDQTVPIRSGPRSSDLAISVFGLVPGWTGQTEDRTVDRKLLN